MQKKRNPSITSAHQENSLDSDMIKNEVTFHFIVKIVSGCLLQELMALHCQSCAHSTLGYLRSPVICLIFFSLDHNGDDRGYMKQQLVFSVRVVREKRMLNF